MSTFCERIVEIMLPEGGQLMTLGEAYFDESGTDEGSPVCAVAGYVLASEKVPDFNTEWMTALADFQATYFHTTEILCQTGEFAHLSDEEADRLVRQLIPISTHMGWIPRLQTGRFSVNE